MNPGTPRVLAVGEALVGYASPATSVRIAHSFERFPGGAELNVAVALTRLGTLSRWASVLGDDAHGDYLRDVLTELGVQAHVRRGQGPTALMFKAGAGARDPEVLQVRAGTAFARHADLLLQDFDQILQGVTHLHLTGILLGISPASRRVGLALVDACASAGISVSFDPNIRVNLWPDLKEMRQVMDEVASKVTIVLPGVSEGELLLGTREPEAVAEHFLQRGAGEVVVKLGAAGARAWSVLQSAHSRPFVVAPVDTVGAGDGFAAGYLDGYLRGLDLQERLDQASAVGALVTTKAGDLAAMPIRSAVEALLAAPDAAFDDASDAAYLPGVST